MADLAARLRPGGLHVETMAQVADALMKRPQSHDAFTAFL
jgi:hypothetical protein